MRRVPEVEYASDPEYQAGLAQFFADRDANASLASQVTQELMDSPGACVIRGTAPRSSLFKGPLVRLGIEYSGPVDETAERLLDHRGRPWIKFLTVGIEIEDNFEFFEWQYSLLQRSPSIPRIAAEISEYVQTRGPSEFDVWMTVGEADGRSWIVRRSAELPLADFLETMYEEVLSDEAEMTVPDPEIWEIRRRAIARLAARGDNTT